MIEIIPNYHPFFVHFTVALLLLSCILFLFSFVLKKNPDWQKNCLIVARWNLYIGVVFTIGTLLAGWQAFNSVVHDTPSHEAMKDHRNWAIGTASLFLIIMVWTYFIRHLKSISLLFILLIMIGAGLLLITGYKGGELVYRHGIGVMSLPNSDIAVQSPTEDNHGDHSH